MKVTVKVEGLAEVDAALGRLKPATGKAALRRGAIKALQPLADLAASLAPKATGALAESIVVSAKAKGAGADRGKAAFAAAMRGGASKKEAGAAKRSAMAAAQASGEVPSVELFMGPAKGTKRAAIKSVVQEFGSRKQAPHPYMRPAWDRDQAALLQRVATELRSEIDKSVARAAKAGKLRT